MATNTYTQVELMTLNGPEFRRVSTAPPRLPTADEIPIIDLALINGSSEEKQAIASKVKAAAENTGFFYIRNHGIAEDLIQSALAQAKAFFEQPTEEKSKLAPSKYYHGVGDTQINRSESRDKKETFAIKYSPTLDPTHSQSEPAQGTDEINTVWDATNHLPGFRDITTTFWQSNLALARQLVRIFALALGAPEDYFDKVTTHPGADGLYIHYPGISDPSDERLDVGIGAHTDIQCFTLLWQDQSGGLQVLSAQDEWLDARPIEGTFVVNIADFLQRLSNNRFKSTVHKVYNRQVASRYSMPFFFGFNPEYACEVVPSCVDEEHPALYGPISCGDWLRERMALARVPRAAV